MCWVVYNDKSNEALQLVNTKLLHDPSIFR